MTDRNLCKESSGAIRETISMMSTAWTDNDIISKLRQDFSSMSTMNRAREELKDLKQLPGQPISSYMYKYGRIHFLTTGNQARNERYPTAIMEFIESLNPKLMRCYKLNSAVCPVVLVDSFLCVQLILYANNTELILLCI